MDLLKRQTGKFITSPMVGVLLGSHFYGCIEGLSGSVALGRVGGTGGVARPIVTFGKIRWAIMSFGSFKSPRGERIRPVCLQQGIQSLLPILCRLSGQVVLSVTYPIPRS